MQRETQIRHFLVAFPALGSDLLKHVWATLVGKEQLSWSLLGCAESCVPNSNASSHVDNTLASATTPLKPRARAFPPSGDGDKWQ